MDAVTLARRLSAFLKAGVVTVSEATRKQHHLSVLQTAFIFLSPTMYSPTPPLLRYGLAYAARCHNGEEMKLPPPATTTNLAVILNRYPLAPPGLLDIYRHVDGTWPPPSTLGSGLPLFRWPTANSANLLPSWAVIDGADFSHPQSRGEKSAGTIAELFDGNLPERFDPRIDPTALISDWLWFGSDGVATELFVDFHPGPGGVCGQIINPIAGVVYASTFTAFLDICVRHYHELLSVPPS